MQDSICSTQPRMPGKRISQKYTPNSCHETNFYSDDDTNRQNMNLLSNNHNYKCTYQLKFM